MSKLSFRMIAEALPLIGGASADPAGSSNVKILHLAACREGQTSPDHFSQRGRPVMAPVPTSACTAACLHLAKAWKARKSTSGNWQKGGLSILAAGGWGFAKIQGPRALCTERAQRTPNSRRGSLKAGLSINDWVSGRPGWSEVREPSLPACAWPGLEATSGNWREKAPPKRGRVTRG